MRVLVIGGNGFIGSHLTDFLVSQGQSVRVYSRSYNQYIKKTDEDVEYIYGEFTDDSLLNSALQDIEIVYQLISTTVPSTSNKNPKEDIASNVISTIKLLENCVNASVKKVIFPSSGGTIYGSPQKLPISEDDLTNPICSYGITKLAIEKYLYLFNYLYGLDYSILRISNPYGPRQNPMGNVGVITVFLNHILNKRAIQIWGDGEIVRDYIYISDVVQALYYAQTSNSSQKLFNIGSGQGVSLNQLISKIRQTLNKDFEVEYMEGRKVDIPVNVLDINTAKKILEWQPTIDLEVGIQKTWQWLQTL
ncbi:NAD-dependent epimerase/dehydratase family protein [Pseudanabaena sp. FACHB-1998]|uniref:NAD-dependent epimerase/dehydratase family protein n=1 Tax=Pseudanabaena sp. FACHB-1998 TaxID=2692858 RepID=UPI00168010BA|nr:NAD-dependent epimerase/dehydratase family protein [Pseudanabaena sp. FACHB-1998]MBD2177246.1 NAD-dependent epimerase/dehydratase family protein [Pseudanabaena sp. FACHB-1998]